MEDGHLTWRKAALCESGSCVEVAAGHAHVHIRQSQLPDGPWLSVSRSSWQAFLTAVRAGDFDVTG